MGVLPRRAFRRGRALAGCDDAVFSTAIASCCRGRLEVGSPYQQLTLVALEQKQWEELVNLTERLLQLDPTSFSKEWHYDAVGNFYLNCLAEMPAGRLEVVIERD